MAPGQYFEVDDRIFLIEQVELLRGRGKKRLHCKCITPKNANEDVPWAFNLSPGQHLETHSVH